MATLHRTIAGHISRQLRLFAFRKHWPVVVILLAGTVLSIVGYSWARHQRTRELESTFAREAETQVNAIEAVINRQIGKVRIMADLFQSLPDIEQREFGIFAQGILARRPSVLAFEWAPRVTDDQRDEFVRGMRESGYQDFEITQIHGDSIVPSSRRPEYFPVALIEPFEPNADALGLDMATRPFAAKALADAARSGDIRVSLPLGLVQGGGGLRGMLAFAPAYEIQNRRDVPRQVKGFAVGVYRVSGLMEEALEPFSKPSIPLVHRLYLQTGRQQYTFVAGEILGERPEEIGHKELVSLGEAPFRQVERFGLGGQSWVVMSEPVAGAVAEQRRLFPWAILATGLVMTLIVAAYFWLLINRAVEIERTVEERTAELGRANEELRQENVRRLTAEEELSSALVKEREAHEAARQAREDLQVSEELYRVMGETIPYGVWLTDANGEPEYFSPSFLALLEMTLEETRDYGWTRRLPPEDVEAAIASMQHAMRTGQMWETEHRFMGPDKQYHTVLVRGLPVRDSAGRIKSWVGINLDITQRKSAEEELRQHRDYLEELVRSRTLELMIANEELRRDVEQRQKVEEALRILQENLEEQVKLRTAELAAANRELEAFSYSVSHDLRAPLRHIVGFVQLLQRQTAGQLSESSQRHLQVITQAANRMGKLIDDLLQFSRMGRSAMRVGPTSVAALVEDVRHELQQDLNGREVEWVVDPDLPEVSADAALLRVVLVNLISNALKYSRTRETTRIEIGWADDAAEQVTVFVKDNGVGFDMQYADRLFGVFQRLHRAEEFEGTGIGLAIVQRVIHRHGGRIWAEGAVGQGATFYFSLPRGKELDARLEAHSVSRG